jgi:hypothetical protein
MDLPPHPKQTRESLLNVAAPYTYELQQQQLIQASDRFSVEYIEPERRH